MKSPKLYKRISYNRKAILIRKGFIGILENKLNEISIKDAVTNNSYNISESDMKDSVEKFMANILNKDWISSHIDSMIKHVRNNM